MKQKYLQRYFTIFFYIGGFRPCFPSGRSGTEAVSEGSSQMYLLVKQYVKMLSHSSVFRCASLHCAWMRLKPGSPQQLPSLWHLSMCVFVHLHECVFHTCVCIILKTLRHLSSSSSSSNAVAVHGQTSDRTLRRRTAELECDVIWKRRTSCPADLFLSDTSSDKRQFVTFINSTFDSWVSQTCPTSHVQINLYFFYLLRGC